MNITDFLEKKEKICIVGLGYVGLPLAVLFSSKYSVIGFDINQRRVDELSKGIDITKEVSQDKLLNNKNITFTTDQNFIKLCKVIIICVPTPIDKYKTPDLKPIINASITTGRNMSKNSIIIYESTVYPGLTEEICIPILEKESGLKWKKDFFVGYSPERINPGDKEHTVEKIKKVVSGDTEETLDFIDKLYGSVIIAGTHRASSIKVAEAAKVIENTQRDLNIAFVNELSNIFNLMNIDTKEVLEAAGTKWNFLKFEPGLVGGHCIGVDPYYLTFKAESLGYHPQIILAGRRINDNMGKEIAENTVKKLIKADKAVKDSKILILGITFKENVGDVRNTKVIDIYKELREFGVNVYIYDPFVEREEDVKHEYGIELIKNIKDYEPYDAIIFAVKHKEFVEKFTLDILKSISKENELILIDIKAIFDRKSAEKICKAYWRL